MVNVAYEPRFENFIRKLKDRALKERVKKQVRKIIESPEVGKPMRYIRKGTREVYVKPYRLSYMYLKNVDKIVFLNVYHKDEQ